MYSCLGVKLCLFLSVYSRFKTHSHEPHFAIIRQIVALFNVFMRRCETMSSFVCVIEVLKHILMIPSFAIIRKIVALFNVFMLRCETMSSFVCVIVVLKQILMIPSFAIIRQIVALFNVFMLRCETMSWFVCVIVVSNKFSWSPVLQSSDSLLLCLMYSCLGVKLRLGLSVL